MKHVNEHYETMMYYAYSRFLIAFTYDLSLYQSIFISWKTSAFQTPDAQFQQERAWASFSKLNVSTI